MLLHGQTLFMTPSLAALLEHIFYRCHSLQGTTAEADLYFHKAIESNWFIVALLFRQENDPLLTLTPMLVDQGSYHKKLKGIIYVTVEKLLLLQNH